MFNEWIIVLSGVVAGLWQRFKGLLENILDLFIARISVDGIGRSFLKDYLKEHSYFASYSRSTYFMETQYIRSRKEHQKVWTRGTAPSGWFLFHGIPIWFSSTDSGVVFGSFRWFINFDEILIAAAEYYNETYTDHDVSRYFFKRVMGSFSRNLTQSGDEAKCAEVPSVQSSYKHHKNRRDGSYNAWEYLGYDGDDLGIPVPPSMSDVYVITKESQVIFDEMEFLLEHRSWFIDKSLPWRRGYLLYGPPGSGKSSFVRTTAQHLDIPVFLFDLGSLYNESLVQQWEEMQNECSPCIALFEDIDNTFHGRDSISSSSWGVTFDCLLNLISGVEDSDGIITVITTNNIEMVDKALGGSFDGNKITSRPGRVDHVVEFGALEPDERLIIIKRIIADHPDDWQDLVDKTDGMMGAQIQEVATRFALDKFWETHSKENGNGKD